MINKLEQLNEILENSLEVHHDGLYNFFLSISNHCDKNTTIICENIRALEIYKLYLKLFNTENNQTIILKEDITNTNIKDNSIIILTDILTNNKDIKGIIHKLRENNIDTTKLEIKCYMANRDKVTTPRPELQASLKECRKLSIKITNILLNCLHKLENESSLEKLNKYIDSPVYNYKHLIERNPLLIDTLLITSNIITKQHAIDNNKPYNEYKTDILLKILEKESNKRDRQGKCSMYDYTTLKYIIYANNGYLESLNIRDIFEAIGYKTEDHLDEIKAVIEEIGIK